MRHAIFASILVTAVAGWAASASAATYGELAGGNGMGPQNPWPTGPYAAAPTPGSCPQCQQMPMSGGPQGMPPSALDAPGTASLPASWYMPPEAGLPFSRDGRLPGGALQVWSFGQQNSTTDPYNQWGLSTPFMFVPWSTPLSGWTNAQTWNWWRERSGIRSPLW